MVAREVKVFRGWVWLGPDDTSVMPESVRSMHFVPVRWLSRSLDATVAAGARFVSVRHRCQTSSSDYVAYLGAAYRPGAPVSLVVRVGVGDTTRDHLDPHQAAVVLDAIVETVASWPERPAGEIVVDHASRHPVDDKAWAWRGAARLAAHLLGPGADRLNDEAIRALGDRYLVGRE